MPFASPLSPSPSPFSFFFQLLLQFLFSPPSHSILHSIAGFRTVNNDFKIEEQRHETPQREDICHMTVDNPLILSIWCLWGYQERVIGCIRQKKTRQTLCSDSFLLMVIVVRQAGQPADYSEVRRDNYLVWPLTWAISLSCPTWRRKSRRKVWLPKRGKSAIRASTFDYILSNIEISSKKSGDNYIVFYFLE